MDVSLHTLEALVGASLQSTHVVEFFLTQPATANRRRQGRTDLNGIHSLSSKQHGYEVDHKKGRIETIFVYLRGKDDYSPFRGELSRGLLVEDSREEVLAKLGEPTRSGYADSTARWPWDRYDSERLCLHITYGESGNGLRMLTLMAPDVAP
jgi:hypothetical protein